MVLKMHKIVPKTVSFKHTDCSFLRNESYNKLLIISSLCMKILESEYKCLRINRNVESFISQYLF